MPFHLINPSLFSLLAPVQFFRTLRLCCFAPLR